MNNYLKAILWSNLTINKLTYKMSIDKYDEIFDKLIEHINTRTFRSDLTKKWSFVDLTTQKMQVIKDNKLYDSFDISILSYIYNFLENNKEIYNKEVYNMYFILQQMLVKPYNKFNGYGDCDE